MTAFRLSGLAAGRQAVRAVAIGTYLLLGACAGSSKQQAPFADNVGSVLSQPLRDVNLQRQDIPPVLKQSLSQPYAIPTVFDCAGTADEIAVLDKLVGPDVDELGSSTNKKSRIGNIDAWAIAQDAVGGLIPFRGIVRHVTGAEIAALEYRRAVLAGFVRRAYLKGVRNHLNCAVIPTIAALQR